MIRLDKDKLASAPAIFFLYVIGSGLLIMGFRLVFPGEAAPLACFSSEWRFLRGIIEFMTLYPALSLSGLVIPFGLKIIPHEKLSAYSHNFLQFLRASVFTAIAAAGIFAVLSLLALPTARNYEAGLRYQGRLYQLARDKARSHADLGEWTETARFVEICERIWPLGPDIEKIRTESNIRVEEAWLTRIKPAEKERRPASAWPDLPDQKPVSAAEALSMAETALNEERYYDAHWLAALGGWLAGTGSAETAAAARIANRAWNALSSMAPNSRETEAYRIYHLKREAYEALLGEDWVRAYYIFLELTSLSPGDPDVHKYLALSEQGSAQIAFFTDEMDLTLGGILTGAVFSLPHGLGRMVMRVSSLTVFPDSAYGIGLEILAFDRDARPAWHMEAPYVKLLPLPLENETRVSLITRALDRHDKTKRWEPSVQGMGESPPPGAQLNLNISWDDFILLTEIRRGADNLPSGDLLAAAGVVGNYGYMPQVLEAEVLFRFAQPLLFLPLAVLALVIGWRYRALKWPRYLAVPMMAMLPLVFNGLIHFCRSGLSNIGIWAVITLGLGYALVVFGICAFILVVVSLIILAAQH